MRRRGNRRIAAAAAMALFVLAAGCGAGPGGAVAGGDASSKTYTVRVGGMLREYRLDLPAGRGRVPLIVGLHAGGSTPDQFARVTGLGSRGPAAGFAVAYPRGIGGTWNAGDCCGAANARGIDDVAFVDAMLGQIGRRPRVETGTVYATGFSNGGKLAYVLACERADRFGAISVGGTALPRGECAPERPVSVLDFHGTADRFHPFRGGYGGISTRDLRQRSVPATVDEWARLDHCPARARTSYERSAARCRERSPCGEGTAVVLCVVKGMGHQWPGATPVLPRILGPGTTDLDATGMTLRFFERHPRTS